MVGTGPVGLGRASNCGVRVLRRLEFLAASDGG